MLANTALDEIQYGADSSVDCWKVWISAAFAPADQSYQDVFFGTISLHDDRTATIVGANVDE